MRIVVTGATGFIGREIVNTSLQRGHLVTAVVRDLEKAKSLLPASQRLRFHAMRDLSEFVPKQIFEEQDALIHLAWGGVGKYTDPSNLLDNLGPQFLFLQSALAAGVKNLTVAGSCLEYGLKEGCASETDQVSPVTFYGLAKKTLYDMIVMSMPQSVSLKWLRYFYVYGDGQRSQAIIPQLRAAILRGEKSFNMSPGDQGRDFIHVRTAAFNTVLAAEQEEISGVINIGNGRAITVENLVESVLSAENYAMTLHKGVYGYPAYEPFSFWADTSKMMKIKGMRQDEKICM